MSILSDFKNSSNSLRTLAIELREVLDDDELEWKQKYDLVFQTHRHKIEPALEDAGLNLEYYDPDTSYEEDVRAYVYALERLLGM